MGANSSTLIDYNPDDYADETELNLNPGSYPNAGNYTLETCPMGRLARMSQQEQMRFSDAICRRYAKNPIFLEKQRKLSEEHAASDNNEDWSEWNETAIGNAAFIAFHNPEGFWQDHYQESLAAMKELYPADDERTNRQMEKLFGRYQSEEATETRW